MFKYQMQDVDCIAWMDVFLLVQTGHGSNIKIDISVVSRNIPILSVIGPETIQFRISTYFKYQNSSISSNSVQHKYAV